jgi:hypothetical protein
MLTSEIRLRVRGGPRYYGNALVFAIDAIQSSLKFTYFNLVIRDPQL